MGGPMRAYQFLWMMILAALSSGPVLAAAAANNPPTAKNASLSANPNQTRRIDVGEVAFDADGDQVSFSNIITRPAHGSISIDGSIYYTPFEGYTGTDKFDYEVADSGQLTARGTVTLYIGVPIGPQVATLNINVQGGATQLAKLNSSAILGITLTDESDQPVAGADVAWSVTQRNSSAQPGFTSQDTVTDDAGVAHATLSTSSTQAEYEINVTASLPTEQTATATFTVIATTLGGGIRPGTPEAAMAATLDVMCRALQAATDSLTSRQQELLARCIEIMNATDSEAGAALRALAPDEAAAQGRIGNSFRQQQLSNIGARLSALRGGASGLGLSGLSFNIKGSILPGSVLVQALEPDTRSAATVDLPQAIPKWGGFISGTVGGGDKARTASEQGFNFRSRGITAGADYRHSSTVVYGAALGYARSDVNLDADGGGLDANALSLSLYGTYYRTQSFYLDAVLNYAANDYDQTRNIDYFVGSTHIQKTARSDSGGKLLALSAGGGYEFTARSGASMEVSLRLHRIVSTIDGYTETGADALNLALGDQTIRVLSSSLGTRGSWPLSLKWGVLIPQLDASWEHELSGGAHQIKGSFVNDPFATPFAFKTDAPDRDYFQLGLGVSAIIPGGKTAFLQYQTNAGRDHYRDYNVALGARVELR